jgi:acetone carboxylase gamma subunit
MNVVNRSSGNEWLVLTEDEIRYMIQARIMFHSNEDPEIHIIKPKKRKYVDIDECSICLSDKKRVLQQTDCGHIFCRTCSNTHFHSSDRCPMCRKIVESLTNVYKRLKKNKK